MYVNKSGGNETSSRRHEGRQLRCRGGAAYSAPRPPGTMLVSRCLTGTSSTSPSATLGSISASAGSRHISSAGNVQPPSSPGGAVRRRCSPRHPETRAPAPCPTSASPAVGCWRRIPYPLAPIRTLSAAWIAYPLALAVGLFLHPIDDPQRKITAVSDQRGLGDTALP
jgi:hypothetical protein